MQVRANNKKQIFENILNVNQTIFAHTHIRTYTWDAKRRYYLLLVGMRLHKWFANNHELRTHARMKLQMKSCFVYFLLLLVLLLWLKKQRAILRLTKNEDDYQKKNMTKRQNSWNSSQKQSKNAHTTQNTMKNIYITLNGCVCAF